jgi:phage shock protein E
MKKILSMLIVIGLVFGMGETSLSADRANPLIIDVRTEAEWNDGHIKDAVLIPYEQIGEKIGTIAKDKSKRIYLYCRTGRRTKIAKDTLEKLGYKDVINLKTLENAAETMKLKIVKNDLTRG